MFYVWSRFVNKMISWLYETSPVINTNKYGTNGLQLLQPWYNSCDSKEKIRNNQQTNKDVSIGAIFQLKSPQATSIQPIWKLGHDGVISFAGLPFRGWLRVRSQDLDPKTKTTSFWESCLPFLATNSCKCIPHEIFWTSCIIFMFAKLFKFNVYKLKSETTHQVQYTCIVITFFGINSVSSAQWCNKINLPTMTNSFQTQAYIYI